MITLDKDTRPLGLRECIPLTEAQRLQLEKLERYDMEFVAERLADKGLLPEELIPETIAKYKRFVALFVLGHQGLDVPSAEVDEVWHAHILSTREYADFCDHLGVGFIHHVPYTRRSPRRPASRTSYWELYSQHFGQVEGTAEVTRSHCHSNCHSCHQCHGCGISASAP